jgi:hypothetical protein
MGTPNPKYGKFEYILDFIAEYNAKMAQDLETEAR